jgi:dTDP-4-amino-4,6-dideoxygalactose transaminase
MREADDFLIFGAPNIEQPEIDEVVSTLLTGWIGTGPKTLRFERDFAEYKGVSRCAAVNSCTAALHLSLLSAGLQPGDEVITTPLTFCATVNAIIHAGAKPVLADIDPRTMNIDPKQVRSRITPRTRALLIVHFAGRPCEMDNLLEIAAENKLKVIEDCAHAVEAEYRGKKLGTLGDFGCFSFYATKNITTGEGGMVIAANEEDLSRVKVMALHGMSKDAWKRYSDSGFKHYQVVECGFKYNMMDIQAAIGIHQLRRIEEGWRRRKEIWSRYDEAFAELPVSRPLPPEGGTRHGLHLYTLLIDKNRAGIERDEFLSQMHAQNIGVGVHYMSIPEHPFYQQTFGWAPDDYPAAMMVGRMTVSLPLSSKLSNKDVDDVIEAVRNVIMNKSVAPGIRQ